MVSSMRLWRVTARVPHAWRRGVTPQREVVACMAETEEEARALVLSEIPGAVILDVALCNVLARLR